MTLWRTGDIFKREGCILATAGSSVNDQGELEMDEEIKQQLKKRIPGIEWILGSLILETCGNRNLYGLMLFKSCGVLQVGFDSHTINWHLLRYSAGKLSIKARMEWNRIFNLTFNGLANDRIPCLMEILNPLPDNVHVWIDREVVNGLHA